MQAPAEVRRIVAGKRRTQRVRRGERLARQQYALDRRLTLGERALESLALRRQAGGLDAQLPVLGLQRSEGAVRLRDRALGVAQRIARFAARCLLRLQLGLQRLDAAAQRLQVALVRGRLCRERGAGESERNEARQTLALPCAETAAMRRATSSASPR